MKQKSFSFISSIPREYGGNTRLGKRKITRPLSTKSPIHFILRSENAVGSRSFINKKRKIDDLLATTAKRYGLKIYKDVIHFNHIHMVIKIPNSEAYKAWVRVFTSALAKIFGIAFTQRPYTRLVSWGREFQTVLNYFVVNELEIAGFPRRIRRESSLIE